MRAKTQYVCLVSCLVPDVDHANGPTDSQPHAAASALELLDLDDFLQLQPTAQVGRSERVRAQCKFVGKVFEESGNCSVGMSWYPL
jgi:hypothetical protein